MTSTKTKTAIALLAILPVAIAIACSGRTSTGAAGAAPSDHTGRFVWQDLVTTDVEASRRFYAELFGWQFRDETRFGRPYLLALAGEDFVAGIVEAPAGEDRGSAWLSYMAVPDLETALGHVRNAGGSVLADPVDVGDFGRIAVITDPQGAHLGVARVERSLPDEPSSPRMGHFFWREYLARDADAALAFYGTLAGYQSEVSESSGALDYFTLRRGRTRGALYQIPTSASDIRPNWLAYVRVGDPAALAQRAESLGGRVVIAPRAEVRGGTLAVITDPTGAALALQKWPL